MVVCRWTRCSIKPQWPLSCITGKPTYEDDFFFYRQVLNKAKASKSKSNNTKEIQTLAFLKKGLVKERSCRRKWSPSTSSRKQRIFAWADLELNKHVQVLYLFDTEIPRLLVFVP